MVKVALKRKELKARVRHWAHPLFPRAAGQGLNWRESFDPRKPWVVEFLQAYFRINLAYARLIAVRKSRGNRLPKHVKASRVAAIEKAIANREKLEDRYAAQGLMATPVYKNGLVVELHFVDVHTARVQAAPCIKSSAFVRLNFSLPAGLRTKTCKS
jgi:hypothetical protein